MLQVSLCSTHQPLHVIPVSLFSSYTRLKARHVPFSTSLKVVYIATDVWTYKDYFVVGQ